MSDPQPDAGPRARRKKQPLPRVAWVPSLVALVLVFGIVLAAVLLNAHPVHRRDC